MTKPTCFLFLSLFLPGFAESALPERTGGAMVAPVVRAETVPDDFGMQNLGFWSAIPLTGGRVAGTVAPVVQLAARVSAPTAVRITLDPGRWYQLNNVSRGLDQLFDGVTNVNVQTGYGKVLDTYEAYYPLLDGEKMTLESLKFFDFEGSFPDKPMTLSVITDTWQRIPVATFTGEAYDTWVGPYPGRSATGDARYRLDAPVANIRYLVLTIQTGMPTEMELYGTYTPPTTPPTPVPGRTVRLRDMFGVNAYEWNFEEATASGVVSETKMNMVKSFTGVRHYMDWEKLESAPGVYSYNPTLSGSWNYDAIYQRCKDANIDVLACLKTLPDWLQKTYPPGQQDGENVPVRYGKDITSPASYLEQAKVGFQYAARYGSNPAVDPALLSVDTKPRWTGDTPNVIRIGTGLVKYIECDNERDKWWKGRKAYQTAREYAANLSAFYDGHKNSMGPGVGVKNADPAMQVVVAGLVSGPDYIRGMVDWCKEFRGHRPDGTVNLCWDIINFHIYTSNDPALQQGVASTRGAAPEVTTAARQTLNEFRRVAHEYANDMPVWITETGFDLAQTSPLKAIPIGAKSARQTQADWILRTALFSARLGISKVFFFQMYDDNTQGGLFGSSGLIESGTAPERRPAADYLYQTNKLFGEYVYKDTVHPDPVVDRYEANGKPMYAVVVPDEIGRTAPYTLDLGTATTAWIYRPKAGAADMSREEVKVTAGKLTLMATETPLFVTTTPVTGTDTSPVNTGLITAIDEPSLHTALKLYPNPTADFVTIVLDNSNRADLELSVFDAGLGRLRKQLTVQKTTQVLSRTIDLSGLPAGVYIIDVKQGADRAFRKLVKER